MHDVPIRLFITGTGRCGTGYVSRLLTESGLGCGHEVAYGLPCIGVSEQVAEASWIAAPWLDQWKGKSWIVHLVRDPVLCIRSLASQKRQFGPYDELSKYGIYTYAMMEKMGEPWDEDVGIMARRFWFRWNGICEEICDVRVRVEDVGIDFVENCFAKAGGTFDVDRVTRALDSVSRSYNSRDRDDTLVVEFTPEERDMVTRYGYDC